MTSTANFRASTASTTTPTSDVRYNTPNAALTGASTAFARPTVKPKPSFTDYAGKDGALIAATKAGSRQDSPVHVGGGREGFVSRQSTGSSRQSSISLSPLRWGLRTPDSTSTLQPPSSTNSDRTRSPSNIAATLAAARYTPITSKTQPRPNQPRSIDEMRDSMRATTISAQMRRIEGQRAGPESRQPLKPVAQVSVKPTVQEKPTDETPIPPTSSLVKLFEQNRPAEAQPSRPRTPDTPSPKAIVDRPPILSPTPRRTISLKKVEDEKKVEETARSLSRASTTSLAPTPAPKPKRLSSIKSPASSKARPLTPSKPAGLERVSVQLPQTPPARPVPKEIDAQSVEELSPVSSYASAEEEPSQKKPQPPPPRRTAQPRVNTSKATSLSPPKLSPIRIPYVHPLKTSHTAEPYYRPTSTPTSAYGRQSLRHIATHMTGDSLANAMVGAALASSRNPSRNLSPVRAPAPPPPRRSDRANHAHNFFRRSRTPSPVKYPGKLRQTLRKESTSSSESDENTHKRKGMFRRKHPNKHHEGARKRWRDAVTNPERKRYEGVWAANKGVCMRLEAIPPHQRSGNEDSEVLDLVVKDLWIRSRLPVHTLEEVWELVDGRKVNRLTKEEFVVGLWLVDQMLKGRKLPTRVSESVWASVTGLGVYAGRKWK